MLTYYEQLTNEEKMLVNSEVQGEEKSSTTAYLLWFFLGTLGMHNFYLGKKNAGIAQLVLNIVGCLTLVFIIGFLVLFALGIWVFIDVFTISKTIEENKEQSRELKAQRIIMLRNNQQETY